MAANIGDKMSGLNINRWIPCTSQAITVLLDLQLTAKFQRGMLAVSEVI